MTRMFPVCFRLRPSLVSSLGSYATEVTIMAGNDDGWFYDPLAIKALMTMAVTIITCIFTIVTFSTNEKKELPFLLIFLHVISSLPQQDSSLLCFLAITRYRVNKREPGHSTKRRGEGKR